MEEGGAPERPGWIAAARRPEIVRRSLRVSAVVGTAIAAINYSDRALAGALANADWLKMAVTYLVPYCVSTWASVKTLRNGWRGSR